MGGRMVILVASLVVVAFMVRKIKKIIVIDYLKTAPFVKFLL